MWTPAKEGPELEWKVRLPRPWRLARTISAFANGRGGVLVVGVADSGEIIGVPNVEAVRAETRRIASDFLDPPVAVATRRRSVDGRFVLEVHVAPARQPVRALLADGRRVVYVRDGSSSRPAGRREEKALEQGPSRQPSLDSRMTRVLTMIDRLGSPTAAAVARAAKMRPRAARRIIVILGQAGLVLERDDGRLWLTPNGHERLRRGGKR